jgi:hypothetical protein
MDIEAQEPAAKTHGKHDHETQQRADQSQGRSAADDKPRDCDRGQGYEEQAEIRPAAEPAQGNHAAGAVFGQQRPVGPDMGQPRAVKEHRQRSRQQTGDDLLPPQDRVDYQRRR